MTYRITGLKREPFEHLFGLGDAELAALNARRVVADKKPGFPCRITLEDANPGESLILTNYVSHDVATPYRTAYAIYVREAALESGPSRIGIEFGSRHHICRLRLLDWPCKRRHVQLLSILAAKQP